MKILLASSAGLYDKNFPETSKSNTGFGHMIRAYADMHTILGDEVDIITQSNLTKGHNIGTALLYHHTISDLVFHFNFFYLRKYFGFVLKNRVSAKDAIHSFLYFMNGAYIEHIVRKNKYDVVHVNGIGQGAVPILYACSRTNTPFLLTLHGLISFDESVKVSMFSKLLERKVLREMETNDTLLCSVISTGMKNRILNDLGCRELNNLIVINNPVIEDSHKTWNIKRKQREGYHVVCVGNISERKNQKMIVDAIEKLPYPERDTMEFVFIGGSEKELKQYSEQLGQKNVLFTGSIERSEVEDYLTNADLCVMASYDEGFGLPIIEGYAKGIPAVIPHSVDAFADLYDDHCCIPVYEYTPEAFAEAIIKAINITWDHELIQKKARQFDMKDIAIEYIQLLKRASETGSSALSTKRIDELIEL